MTKKNRKARRLQELYPEVKIRVFYQRDYLSLLMKYGLEPPSQFVPNGDAPPFWLAEPGDAPPPRRRAGQSAEARAKRRSKSA